MKQLCVLHYKPVWHSLGCGWQSRQGHIRWAAGWWCRYILYCGKFLRSFLSKIVIFIKFDISILTFFWYGSYNMRFKFCYFCLLVMSNIIIPYSHDERMWSKWSIIFLTLPLIAFVCLYTQFLSSNQCFWHSQYSVYTLTTNMNNNFFVLGWFGCCN